MQIYPRRISYTGHRNSTGGVDLPAYYHVIFGRSAGRPDAQLSARNGFITRTDARLTDVSMMAGGSIVNGDLVGGSLVRRYAINYETGDFSKSLLKSVVVLGSDGVTEHYRHTFDYVAAYRNNANELGFTGSTTWANTPPVTFDNGNGESGGVSGSVGLGDPSFTFRGSIGLNYQRSGGHTSSTQADLNGDGLPDFFTDDGRLWLNHLSPNSPLVGTYDSAALFPVQTALQDEHTDRLSLEGAFHFNPEGTSFNGSVGGSATWSWTGADRMLTDVDGDGRVDLINGPVTRDGSEVLPVRSNPFAMGGAMFGETDPNNPSRLDDYTLGGMEAVILRSAEPSPNTPNLAQQLYRTDPLVRWTAPQHGWARITGAIDRNQGSATNSNFDGVIPEIVLVHNGAEQVLWKKPLITEFPCVPGRNAMGQPVCGGTPIELELYNRDSLFFRVSSGAPGADTEGDEVKWSPKITYFGPYLPCAIPPSGELNRCRPDAPIGLSFDREQDFRLADFDRVAFTAGIAGHVRVQGTVKSAVAATLRVYRRRFVINGMVPQIPANSVLTPAIAQAILNLPATIQLDVIAEIPMLPNVSVALNSLVEVKGGDQVLTHVLLPAEPLDIDPNSVSQWDVTGAYEDACPTGLANGCYTVGACASVPVPVQGANPQLSRMCPLVNAPANTLQSIHETSVVFGQLAAAIGPETPYSISNQRRDGMSGYFRGWSVGEWNGNFETFIFDRVAHPFNLTAAELAALVSHPQDFPAPAFMPVSPRFNGEDITVDGERLVDLRGIPLWRGSGIDGYITADRMKPSQRAPFVLDSSGRPKFSTASSRGRRNAPALRTSYSHAFGAYAAAGGALGDLQVGGSINHVEGPSYSDVDFFDVNGDGLPDSIRWTGTSGFVQYQLRRAPGERHGVFSPPVPIWLPPGRQALRVVDTVMNAGGVNGGAQHAPWYGAADARGTNWGITSTNATAGLATGMARTRVEFVDVNGDGLQDQVEFAGGQDGIVGSYLVSYNLGYAFSRPASLTILAPRTENNDTTNAVTVQQSCNSNFGIGVGGGGAVGSKGRAHWGAGGGPSIGVSRTRVTMMDLNGDGLPDRVQRNRGAKDGQNRPIWTVQFNLGDGFSGPEPWVLPPWPLDASHPLVQVPCINDAVVDDDVRDMPAHLNTAAFSAYIGGGIGIPIAMIVGLSVELAVAGNYDWHRSNAGMSDINGDGVADHVYRDDNAVFARINGYGKVNLLSAIHTPAGATINIEYAREGNHVGQSNGLNAEMPSNRWVLSAVEVVDPQSQTVRSTFSYNHSGNYDRAEREFYGFNHVTERRADNRTVDTFYHNQDFYRRMTPYESITRSWNQNVLSRTVTSWAAPPSNLPARTGQFFPAKTQTISYFYNGTSTDPNNFAASTSRAMFYGPFNLLSYTIDHRDSDSSRDLRTDLTYYQDLYKWVFRPSVLTMRAASANPLDDSTILQRTTSSEFNAQGDPGRVEQRLVGGTDPSNNTPWDGSAGRNPYVNYSYDGYGNVITESDAAGASVQRSYDADTRTHPTHVMDAFTLTSMTTWDLRLSVPTILTDTTGAQSRLEYDQFARVTAVYGPHEVNGATPTVTFDYSLGSGIPALSHWGRSRQTDFSHPGHTIDEIAFVDGFGRTNQRQRTIEIDLGANATQIGTTVSGSVHYDNLGRVHSVSQPWYSPIGVNPTRFPELHQNPTVYEYDAFDRVQTVTAPNNTDVVTHTYDYQAHQGFTRLHRTVQFQRNGVANSTRTAESFLDLEGNVLLLRQSNTIGGALQTLDTIHNYDLLNRRTLVRDAALIETHASYDSLGRMIELLDPDSGSTTFEYSLSGDLASRATPRLRANGGKIRYFYDRHRLTSIQYPDPTMSVQYTYGWPGAPYYSAGRVTDVQDGSGSQKFRYGIGGELVWTERTLRAFGGFVGSVKTTTQFAYDGHGRMTSMQYPDGEVLTYRYNWAGMVDGVSSSRRDAAHQVIDRISYDLYGRQRRVTYGNKAETLFTFDPVMQRLQEQMTNATEGTIQRLQYEYNPQGLISTIVNNVTAGPNRGMVSQGFAYDEMNQLRTAVGTFQPNNGPQQTYTLAAEYDSIGRMQQMTQTDTIGVGSNATPVAATTHDYHYTYTAGFRGRAKQVGPNKYTFDVNGNVTVRTNQSTGVVRTLFWDDEDQLVLTNEQANSTQFVYDAGGGRTHKHGEFGTTVYPNAFISVKSSGEITKSYFVSGQRVSTTVNIAEGPSATDRNSWMHTNHHGAVQYITDKDAKVVEHLESLPFGESWIEQRSASDIPARQVTGLRHDRETGLVYGGARYFDPREARWMSRDPALEGNMAGGGVGDPRNLMSYAYSFNSPISYADPDGRQPVGTDAAAGPVDASSTMTAPNRQTITINTPTTVSGNRPPPPPPPANRPVIHVPLHVFVPQNGPSRATLQRMVDDVNRIYQQADVEFTLDVHRVIERHDPARGIDTRIQLDLVGEPSTGAQGNRRAAAAEASQRALIDRFRGEACNIVPSHPNSPLGQRQFRGFFLIIANRTRSSTGQRNNNVTELAGVALRAIDPSSMMNAARGGIVASDFVLLPDSTHGRTIHPGRIAAHELFHLMGVRDLPLDGDMGSLAYHAMDASERGRRMGVELGVELSTDEQEQVRTAVQGAIGPNP